VLAATKAKADIKISSVAFPMLASDPFRALKEIETSKPDFVIKSPAELCKLLSIK